MEPIRLSKGMMKLAEAQRCLAAEYQELKSFSLDGKSVGDIGEVLAAEYFGIELHKPIRRGVDGISPEGYPVQIKATGTKRGPAFTFAVPLQPNQRLLFFELNFGQGIAEVVFNGPEQLAWDVFQRRTPGRSLTAKQIRAADQMVAESDRLRRIK